MSQTILVIGAGLTGSLCASSLYKSLPNCTIKVWDKARGVGGRMTTSRGVGGINSQADLGAQYITTEDSVLEAEKCIYNRLITENLLKPLSFQVEGMKTYATPTSHFVAPRGMGSIVKLILSDLPDDSTFVNHTVSTIRLEGEKLKASTQDNQQLDADIIISTIPVPQLIKSNLVDDLIPIDIIDDLKKVTYSTRFVLVWFYDTTDQFCPDLVSKYIDNDDTFRFVAVDNLKRGSGDPPAVVFHTSVQYGKKYIMKSKEEVAEELNDKASSLFPHWPKPKASKCHKWLYSQVQDHYAGAPGFVVLHSRPTLILAGDSFSSSNFNGCLTSANEVVKYILSEV